MIYLQQCPSQDRRAEEFRFESRPAGQHEKSWAILSIIHIIFLGLSKTSLGVNMKMLLGRIGCKMLALQGNSVWGELWQKVVYEWGRRSLSALVKSTAGPGHTAGFSAAAPASSWHWLPTEALEERTWGNCTDGETCTTHSPIIEMTV